MTLPDEYLLLKVGRSSSFAKNRQIYAANGGPFGSMIGLGLGILA